MNAYTSFFPPFLKQTFSFIVFLFSLLSLPLQAQELAQARPEEVGMSTARLDRLTQTMQHYVDQNQLPGAVALIARKGKIIYSKAVGYRDKEKGEALKTTDIFRIASQTKAIVSVGIMILQEEGKLLLHEPVGKYIPEFNTTTVAKPSPEGSYKVVPAKRKITIRDLLTHTSGIGYGWGMAAEQWKKAQIQGWYFAHRKEPIITTVKAMAKLPQDAHPGEKFVYGYSVDVLGALIEVISKQTLEEFLQEKILSPLGMGDTFFYLPSKQENRLAKVYTQTANGIELAPESGKWISQGQYVNGPRVSFSGGAGYLSTALDYAKFLQMILNQGVYNGKRILSRKSIELMLANHTGTIFSEAGKPQRQGFGLGFALHMDLGQSGTLGSEGDFGWGGAYNSIYWADPKEELIVVYFTQLIPAKDLDDHKKLRSLVYQAIVD